MQTIEQKKNAVYMKKWNAKNKERISKQRKNRLKELKKNESDYKEFRIKANKRNVEYKKKNINIINKKQKEKNWYYNKEDRIVIRKRHYQKNLIKNIISQRKCFAKKHNLPFEITYDWYVEQLKNGCVMTGITFAEGGYNKPFSPHIDRKIPELGYTVENSRLVCASYNLAKKNWREEDVLKMAKNLIKKNKHV